MKNKLVKLATIIISIFGTAGLMTAPVLAADCTDICNCPGVSEEIKAASGCKNANATINSLEDTVMTIINSIFVILGIVAVICIVIGGVQYMTSTGEASKIKKAKDTILYACIGLAVILLAALIVNFVADLILNNPTTP